MFGLTSEKLSAKYCEECLFHIWTVKTEMGYLFLLFFNLRPTCTAGVTHLCVRLDDVALDLVHGVRAVGHRPQV